MPLDHNNGNLLSSWKEISDFLKCDVKTCRRWERTAGLPVHRVSDVSKSRVFAYKDELDAWVKKRAVNGAAVRLPAAPQARRRPGLRLGFGLGAAALALVLLWAFILKPRFRPPLPVDFRIERSELVILDARGRELWRFDTGRDSLWGDVAYRSGFQAKKNSLTIRSRVLPLLIIRDINNDTRPEVLFAVLTQDELHGGVLYCFDSRGGRLWEFRAGREMTFGSKVYSSEYLINGIETRDFDGDGKHEIMVIGFQRPDWPTQFVLLAAGGKLLGEYWHSGQLNDYDFADLDKDGVQEIILAGLNNEYGKGCLLAFSPDRIQGGSPQQKKEFICRDLRPGSELYYVLFPRTDVDLALGPVEAVGRLSVVSGERLQIEMLQSGIFYFLDYRLAVADHTISHTFRQLHEVALEGRRITSTLDDKYGQDLLKGFLYFDGRDWTPDPTPLRRGPASSK
jgi:hypothetical protein